MNRRRLLTSVAAVAGISGCISQNGDAGNTSESGEDSRHNVTEVERLPDSCPEDERFVVNVGNRTGSSKHVVASLWREGDLVLRTERTLESDGTESDGFIVHSIGCLGDSYSFEVDVEGRERVEYSFTASYAGVLTALVQEDEVYVKFQGAD